MWRPLTGIMGIHCVGLSRVLLVPVLLSGLILLMSLRRNVRSEMESSINFFPSNFFFWLFFFPYFYMNRISITNLQGFFMQKDYKMFPPSVNWDNINWSTRRPQMDFPVQVLISNLTLCKIFRWNLLLHSVFFLTDIWCLWLTVCNLFVRGCGCYKAWKGYFYLQIPMFFFSLCTWICLFTCKHQLFQFTSKIHFS